MSVITSRNEVEFYVAEEMEDHGMVMMITMIVIKIEIIMTRENLHLNFSIVTLPRFQRQIFGH